MILTNWLETLYLLNRVIQGHFKVVAAFRILQKSFWRMPESSEIMDLVQLDAGPALQHARASIRQHDGEASADFGKALIGLSYFTDSKLAESGA